MSRRVVAGLAVLIVVGVASAGPGAYGDDRRHPHPVFVMDSPEITESSSLVVGSAYQGIAYTANDSGDDATVYAVDTSSGAVVGHTTLAGVQPVDIEAMAGCADGSLVVGDIGDNAASRSEVVIYRLAQPRPGRHLVSADRLALRYPDGPHDAESVACDAASGTVFVVSKQPVSAAVYATPPGAFHHEVATLRPVAPAPGVATDATVLPGGQFAVIRTYVGAAIYRFPSWRVVRSIPLPRQQQGESVAAPAGGHVLWVGSEGRGSAVLAVPLPRLPGTPRSSPQPTDPARPGPAETAPAQAGAEADEGMSVANWTALVGCAGLAVAVSVWLFARHRRQDPPRD